MHTTYKHNSDNNPQHIYFIKQNLNCLCAAEFIAKEYEISREEQDLYALRSQRLASQAHARGYFAAELVPVDVSGYVPYVPPIPLSPSGGIASKMAAFELRERTDTTGWPLPLGTPLPSATSLPQAPGLITCPSAPALAHTVYGIGIGIGTVAPSSRTGAEPAAEPTPLVKTSKGKWVTADETIRHEVTLDALRKLAPVFAQDAALGSVTAGNASSTQNRTLLVRVSSDMPWFLYYRSNPLVLKLFRCTPTR